VLSFLPLGFFWCLGVEVLGTSGVGGDGRGEGFGSNEGSDGTDEDLYDYEDADGMRLMVAKTLGIWAYIWSLFGILGHFMGKQSILLRLA
jgi:hypothetical protein